MHATRKRLPRWFWIRLLAVAAGWALLWPLVRAPYVRHLGDICASLIPPLSIAEVTVRDVTLNDRLVFHLVLRPPDGRPPLRIRHAVATPLYGLGLVIFLALVLALPGVPLRRRWRRALLGLFILQIIQIFAALFDVFAGLAGNTNMPWPGDRLTNLLPARWYFDLRDYSTVLIAQVLPVLLWLIMFVFPVGRRGTSPAPSPAIPDSRSLKHAKRSSHAER